MTAPTTPVQTEGGEHQFTAITAAPAGWWQAGTYRVEPDGPQMYWRARIAVFGLDGNGTGVRGFIADPSGNLPGEVAAADPNGTAAVHHDDDFARCVCQRPDLDRLGFCSNCGGIQRGLCSNCRGVHQ